MGGSGGAAAEARVVWWLVLVGPLGVGAASVGLGQSANWDLLNYHLYDPHAWLTGRWRIDVAPAQLQSFFNPLLHVPYYLGLRALPPRAVAFLVGATQGLHLPLLYALGLRVLPPAPARPRIALAAAILGMLGPVFLSEIGTVFGDTLVSLPLLSALLLILTPAAAASRPGPAEGASAPDAARRADTAWDAGARDAATGDAIVAAGTETAGGAVGPMRLFAAGLLAGAALALKLTSLVFVPALVLAHLAAARGRRAALGGCVPLALGGALGLLVFGGFWYLHLWQAYGNPVFPFRNDWFRSPWAQPWAFTDRRFLPHGAGEALVYPLVAAWEPTRVMEKAFRDLRPPLLYLALAAAPLVVLIAPARRRPARPLGAVLVFAAASWAAWIGVFGIYRYLAPVEMLAPLALAGLALSWLPAGRPGVAVALGALALTQAAVVVPDWGRVAFGALLPRPAEMRLAPGAMVLAGGTSPTGFAALALPDDVPLLRLASNFHRYDDGTRLGATVGEQIAAHAGPIHVLVADAERETVAAELRGVGLALALGTCRASPPAPLPPLQGHLLVCDALRDE